jgi:putative heme d1 biosynthesis radical SAM protein NirJ2
MLVSWNTTNACNLKCSHCYRDAGEAAPGELDFEEGCRLLGEIRQAGFRVIVFSGGEPLLRPDIFDLIAHASSLGLRPVCGTNGTLITPGTAARLKEAGVAVVGISLDSINPENHDRFRGVPGSWQAALDGAANCRAAGLPFQLHTTVFPWNYGEIEPLNDLAVQIGARGHHVFFFVPTGRGRGHEEMLDPGLTEDLLVRLLERQTELPLEIKPTCAPQFVRVARQRHLPTRFRRGCLAGISYCIIGPQGDVYPCPYMNLKVGNVRSASFDDIWRHNEAFLKLRSQKYGGYCGICAYRGLCGGCRARSYAMTGGDFMGEDPLCLYKEEQEEKIHPLAERLIIRLQSGLPLVPRPFKALAEELGTTQGSVLRAMRWLTGKGIVRRLGATFDSQSLGYTSTLCAVRVPPERLEEVAAIINAYPGVTHNYLREHDYNLWFTLIAGSAERLASLIREIGQRTGIQDIISLPAVKTFKIAVTFPEDELSGVFTEDPSDSERGTGQETEGVEHVRS